VSNPVIDLHADTFAKKLAFVRNKKFVLPAFDVQIEDVFQANIRLQTQSLFLNNSMLEKPLANALLIIKQIKDFIQENDQFYLFKCQHDLDLEQKYGIIIAIEGLEVIEEKLDLLDIFYELGVRIIAPTWNRITPWLSPICEPSGGFSRLPELVKKLKEFRLIIDISHLSDQSVFDLAKIYDRILIASHSNVRSLNPFPRNINDEILEIIKERNGVVGINFCPDFLRSEILRKVKPDFPESFHYLLNIIEYFDQKNALQNLSFGTDLDGISDHLPGLQSYQAFPEIEFFLQAEGILPDIIENIFYKNALRVLSTL